jgi:hypothetical protein
VPLSSGNTRPPLAATFIVGGYRYGQSGSDVGKFVLALRLAAGGRWLIAADIDNSNTPPKTDRR